MAVQTETPGDRQNVDAILAVSVAANDAVYEEIRRNNVMCEALRNLMKDEFERAEMAAVNKGLAEGLEKGLAEGLEKGMEKGMQKGRTEGILSTLSTLVKKGLLTLKDASAQANMSEQEFTKMMAAQS